MRFRFWLAGAGIAVAVALAGGWLALGRPGPEALMAALPGIGGGEGGSGSKGGGETAAGGVPELAVGTAEAVAREVPISFDYTGTIVSPKDAELMARVTGVVTARPFEPGGEVKDEQLLFQIDQRPFEIALESAQAQKAQAETGLSFAKSEVERASILRKKGFETDQRTQQLSSQRATAQAKLQEDEATIARQKLNIEYATIRAPFAGRASLSQINVGDTVIANQTKLASVVQLDPIDLQVALSAADAEAVREAMARGDAEIAVVGDDGAVQRKARIYKLDNRFDPRTARRLVRALLHNADERYLPGQFVRARIETGTARRVLVPTVALSTQLDQQIVFAVHDDGTVGVVAVETGDAFGDMTAITKGVEPGLRIATDHLQRLHAGDHVAVAHGPDRSARRD